MKAFTGAAIFDGFTRHEGQALLVERRRVTGMVPEGLVPAGVERVEVSGLLAPGLVDLQVNGGGGVLLNEAPTAEGIAAICAAHARSGTTALLPTLITDTPERTALALAAGRAAEGVRGFLGLHLEGPHLDSRRCGAHDPALIRPMEEADLRAMLGAALPHLMVTLAPEAATPVQVSALAKAGVLVSIGHSDTGIEGAKALIAAGARCVTHLFNAMSQLGSREPGLVGAALADEGLWAGIIADGFHVHPASLALAKRAKGERLFLVSDAMPSVGMAGDSFTLNGRIVTRAGGRLTLADGTLAGADIALIDAVRVMVRQVGLSLEEALRMASLRPAQALGVQATHGHLRPGARADMLLLDEALEAQGVWIGGEAAF
ncbi:N-acetylglucosamine-6-phosphate deacetylase [Acetobacteraceae bacterium H6797]|nr:N-acetylglucosamine-6-phosphate deacetylase [Acetobacteraceae bacterium H6797]